MTGASGVTIDSISMNFDGLLALSDVSFSVRPGEVVGVVGTNGSGKSTLLNCISGVYRPTQGSISLDGVSVAGRQPHRLARIGVARTFQHVEAPPELTAIEVAMLGRHTQMRRFGMTAYGFGLPRLLGYEDSHRAIAHEALVRAGAASVAEVPMSEIPYGLAKRVDLARALTADPRLLLLDEPAAGLNATERMRLANSIEELSVESMTVLLVEHDLNFVAQLCSRVLVFVEGRLLYDGGLDEAFENEQVVASFFGGPRGS